MGLLRSFFSVAGLRLPELPDHIVELVLELVLLLDQALVDLLLHEIGVFYEVSQNCVLKTRFLVAR